MKSSCLSRLPRRLLWDAVGDFFVRATEKLPILFFLPWVMCTVRPS